MKNKKSISLIIFIKIKACNNKLVFFNLFEDDDNDDVKFADSSTAETELKMHSVDFEYRVFLLKDFEFDERLLINKNKSRFSNDVVKRDHSSINKKFELFVWVVPVPVEVGRYCLKIMSKSVSIVSFLEFSLHSA